MLTTIRLALLITLLLALTTVLTHPTIHAAAPASSLPAITAAQPAGYGGMRVWRVSFASGATCDVPVALLDTMSSAATPSLGVTRAYADTRILVAGVRFWGTLSFTDSAGQRYTGY
jgi:hypothetical protein